ncbi:hypothetical protein [Chamaesiphon minutus]|uniref:Uncharacterized protein n=1 Tax=Chamaesiphon minutus (strain ATCC 27169 / PCC 6605) TaxID=1173020 RepID=K9UD76_CHAP6|nr:hypothetical protein [Chamaesiphon minutus]AFY92169.1 hypothetical protein Cha6605_0911 [Chamaesiphon minutus PCC 6605]
MRSPWYDLENVNKDSENFGFKQILEEIDEMISSRIIGIDFDVLLSIWKRYRYDEHLRSLIMSEMFNSIDVVVEEFKTSSSYENARNNSSLLIDMFDSLTDSHWNTVHIAFVRNRQIRDSCANIFCELFNKSVRNGNEDLSRYWLIFRGNLNHFQEDSIFILKETIDSYFNNTEI